MSLVEKPLAIKLADWSDWFYRNVKDQNDFRWQAMNNMANELRRLQSITEGQQQRIQVLEEALSQFPEDAPSPYHYQEYYAKAEFILNPT